MIKHLIIAGLVTFGLAGQSAEAGTVDFAIDEGASSVSFGTLACVDGGCTVSASLSPGLSGTTFSLAEGDSAEFDFATVALDAPGLALLDLDASLAFAMPNAVVSNTGVGVVVSTPTIPLPGGNSIGGTTQAAFAWQGPESTVTLADGTVFTVGFNSGLLIPGDEFATATATVTLITAPEIAPVPLPASAVLLLAAVGGLGIAGYRRRTRAAA